MKRITLFVLFTSCLLNFYGQSTLIDCEKKLDKIPYFAGHIISSITDEYFVNDLIILRECGGLDSIDAELLTAQMIGVLMISQAQDNKETTYRSVLNSLIDFKKTESYKIIKEAKLLEKKIVNLSEWEMDRKVLTNTGMPKEEIDRFEKFVILHSTEKLTFKQAFTAYNASQPKIDKPKTEKLVFVELVDMDNVLKISKENRKPILIFFTCYACVSAIKMENYVLIDEQVKSIITKNYVYFSAHVDDSKLDGNTSASIGNKYSKIQSDVFQSNTQPTFVLLKDDGTVIAKTGYTGKVEEFIDFLNKGVK